jgi:hypothetical protein
MEVVCKSCGFVGKPKKVSPGNIFIEIVLWLFFIIPGLIFSLYRMFAKKNVCSKCGSSEILPSDSPEGQKLIKK